MKPCAGHGLFEVKSVELIPLANGNMKGSGREQAAERRYRKLITSGLDLSKDFLVSYSYRLCHTLQANLTKPPTDMFSSRFVWNEYLTRKFRPKVPPLQDAGMIATFLALCNVLGHSHVDTGQSSSCPAAFHHFCWCWHADAASFHAN